MSENSLFTSVCYTLYPTLNKILLYFTRLLDDLFQESKRYADYSPIQLKKSIKNADQRENYYKCQVFMESKQV